MWNPHNFNGEFFLSGHEHGYIWYWNKDTEFPLFQFQFVNQTSGIKNLSFNPIDGNLFACGHEDGKIFIWNMEKWNEANLYFQVDALYFTGFEWHPKQANMLLCGAKVLQLLKISGK